MRICVCGLHREDAVKKLESAFETESVNVNYPGMEDNQYKLFHQAAETFKHFDKADVIFDGGVFDDFKFYSDQGWADLQEQVILSAISNLDKIIIITEGLDEKTIEFCKSFKELYQDKILVIPTANDFSIV